MLLFLYTIVDPEDHPKIEYIYRMYHEDMVRLAKGKLKRADVPNYELDAEDVVQNAYIKISKYIKKIDIHVHPQELRAYLLSIVANETANFLRSYTFCDDIDNYAEYLLDNEFIDSLKINDKYEKVVKVIQNMDEKYSTTILYRFKDEMSISEIAQFMGVPEKTVYSRLERGTKLLYDALEVEVPQKK